MSKELTRLSKRWLKSLSISVTTLDPALSAKLEPRCAAPAKRLTALGKLVELGVPVHCSISPIIPAITDDFIEGKIDGGFFALGAAKVLETHKSVGGIRYLPLSDDPQAVARMTGGVEINDTTLQHAKQLRQLKFQSA